MRRLILLSPAFSLLMIFGCMTNELRSEIPESGRLPSSEDQKAAIRAATPNAEFALDLYKQLAKDDPDSNLFFSPYSVSTVMAMASEGARGDTLREMAETLRYATPNSGEQLIRTNLAIAHHGLGHVGRSVNLKSGNNEIRSANAIWGEKTYPFASDYLATIQRYYDNGSVFSCDFVGSPDDERVRINQWIETQTKQRIRDAIPSGSITDLTRLVLTNAIYFKGDWHEPFEEDSTDPESFHGLDGQTFDVEMMSDLKELCRYAAFHSNMTFYQTPTRVPANPNARRYPRFGGFHMVELPYHGGQLSMILIAPIDPNGLPDIEAKLDAQTLFSCIRASRKRDVVARIPKFSMATSYALGDERSLGTLQKMGMERAFKMPPLDAPVTKPGDASSYADFSGMSASGRPELYISKVLHKAFVEVNEKGTEAAAVTVTDYHMGGFESPKEPTVPFVPEFNADRPFMFMIVHRPTCAILFTGRMVDPRE